MMALVLGLSSIGLFLVLPVWSFARSLRLAREVAELRARVAMLERHINTPPVHDISPSVPPPIAAAATAPAPDPASVASPAPDPVAASDRHINTPPPHDIPPSTPHPLADDVPPDDLEARVGGRWLLYAGVAILLFGVSFFLKYAFDNEWVTATGRVVLGLLSGAALVTGGWRTAQSLRTFGLALAGTGVVALYLSVYAAFDFYALIGPSFAFAAMTVITLGATWLADRGRALSLAVLATAGGYGTPFLIGADRPNADLLFGYVLLLGTGVLWLVRRHAWPALAPLAYGATVLTAGAWAAEHFTGGQWSRVLAWLTAYCLLFLMMLRTVRVQPGYVARIVTVVLWTSPVLYHAAAVAVTFTHPPALHVYLIVGTLVALFVAAERESPWWRLPVLLAGYLPLLAFVEVPRGTSWLWPNIVTAAAIGGMHVLTMVDRSTRQARRLGTGDLLLMHATLIGLYGVLVAVLEGPYPHWLGGTGAVLSMASAALWFFYERRDTVAALHAAGLAFALMAMALAQQFDGRVVVIAWAVEGAVAAWVGLKAGNLPFRAGGLVLLALAAGRLAEAFAIGPAGAFFWNDRAAATLVLVVVCYGLAWHWRRDARLDGERLVPLVLHTVATVFTLLWISAEVDAYWPGTGDVRARLARELSRSLAWGLYGTLLIVVGLWRSLASLRWLGIFTIGLTVLKVFFVDLSALGGIYRVIGFLVLGVLLVGVSYLYQRRQRT